MSSYPGLFHGYLNAYVLKIFIFWIDLRSNFVKIIYYLFFPEYFGHFAEIRSFLLGPLCSFATARETYRCQEIAVAKHRFLNLARTVNARHPINYYPTITTAGRRRRSLEAAICCDVEGDWDFLPLEFIKFVMQFGVPSNKLVSKLSSSAWLSQIFSNVFEQRLPAAPSSRRFGQLFHFRRSRRIRFLRSKFWHAIGTAEMMSINVSKATEILANANWNGSSMWWF